MHPTEKTLLRHWIYVPHDPQMLPEAYSWQNRKSSEGKSYQVIEAAPGGSGHYALRPIDNDDVLYILANSIDSLGTAGELAAHLSESGLDHGHRVVKIFVSRSGDSAGERKCFAEQLYEAMRDEHPEVIVYGYLGGVSHTGFSTHKTAGLKPGETLEGLSESEWNRRKLRAKENRVRFPPGPLDE